MKRPTLGLAMTLLLSMTAACTYAAEDHWRAEFERGQAAYDERRFVDAYRIWLPLAEAGVCKAEFAVGTILDSFNGDVSLTSEEQWQLEQLVVPAQLRTGFEYFYGTDYLNDKLGLGAIYWFQQAAFAGHPNAPYRTGILLQFRFTTYHDEPIPLSARYLERFWFTVGAERGDIDAMIALSLTWAEPEETIYWSLVSERQWGHEEAIGRAHGTDIPGIDPDRYKQLRAWANEWQPRDPLDTTPAECL